MRTTEKNKLHLDVAVELTKKQLRQRDLAARMGSKPSTVSGWLTGATPAPPDLRTRIERALELPKGALMT